MPMLVVTLLLAAVAVVSQRTPELQLDLVAAPPPPHRPFDPPSIGVACGVNVTGISTRPNPLRVTLAETDRVRYIVGDSMSFSVVLENVGSADGAGDLP